MNPPPRSRAQRKSDTLRRLEEDVDLWVATADPATAEPCLVPLSFTWDGEAVLVSTLATNPTGRNLLASGKARVSLGHTRDVILLEASVEVVEKSELSPATGDRFAERTGFDPRALRGRYLYYRLRPVWLQAWREVEELAERDLMADGAWLV